MKLGVIGAKLGHTASPAIHEKLFRILQVEGQHQYGVLEMDRNDIPNELQRLRDEGYTGANVTIPYKLDVMPYLTEISREARIIGAVNTLHFTDNGIFGYNTDYSGFGRSLDHAGIGVKTKDCVVLGSGGAARAIIQYLSDSGAKSITVVSRHPHSKTEFDAFIQRVVPIRWITRISNIPKAATSWSTARLSACSLTSTAVPYRNGSSRLPGCRRHHLQSEGYEASPGCPPPWRQDPERHVHARRPGHRLGRNLDGPALDSSVIEQIAKEMESYYE